jgi:hypothetical protein
VVVFVVVGHDRTLGLALALPANIKLARKYLPGTNTLAYFKRLAEVKKRRFISLTPGQQRYKTFYS